MRKIYKKGKMKRWVRKSKYGQRWDKENKKTKGEEKRHDKETKLDNLTEK